MSPGRVFIRSVLRTDGRMDSTLFLTRLTDEFHYSRSQNVITLWMDLTSFSTLPTSRWRMDLHLVLHRVLCPLTGREP